MASRSRVAVLASFLAVLALAACGSSGKSSAASSSSSTSSSTSTTSTSAIDTTSTTDAAFKPTVALSVDGLTFVTDGNGGTDDLEFGTMEPDVGDALSNTLGAPASTDRNQVCEDGSGRSFDSVRYDVITVYFLNGTMSGWASTSPKMTTLEGIGVSSSLGDLKKSFGDVTVTDSSLGHEFATKSIGGVLDGTTDAAKVTNIFNGDVCIIR